MFLPGKGLTEKIAKFVEMTQNHHLFMIDNLNHKCYHINDKYYCREIKLLPTSQMIIGGERKRKREEEGEEREK
jgi:hypothetical protein